jgi:hypothetical protein
MTPRLADIAADPRLNAGLPPGKDPIHDAQRERAALRDTRLTEVAEESIPEASLGERKMLHLPQC